MAKNKITDLRDHLFSQLERLSDDEDMKNPIIRDREIARTESIVKVSNAIVDTAKIEVQYLKTLSEVGKNGLDVDFIVTDQKQIESGG